MRKRLLLFTIAVTMVFVFASCGGDKPGIVDEIKHTVAQAIKGNIKGEVGKVYGTQWFEFTIESIEEVGSYAGYEPDDGGILVDVVITEKGTFDEPSPMGTFDFYMDSDTFLEYIWPLDPFDGSMMPEEFDLAKDEVVTYHMVFEVPEGLSDLVLMYTEWDEEESEGATFTINVNL